MKYKYTLLKQDGTIEDLGKTQIQKRFHEFYKILNCNIVQIIPSDYYENKKCELYGDEEARFKESNHRNPHFKVLKDVFGDEWDVVGDIIMEEKINENI